MYIQFKCYWCTWNWEIIERIFQQLQCWLHGSWRQGTVFMSELTDNSFNQVIKKCWFIQNKTRVWARELFKLFSTPIKRLNCRYESESDRDELFKLTKRDETQNHKSEYPVILVSASLKTPQLSNAKAFQACKRWAQIK